MIVPARTLPGTWGSPLATSRGLQELTLYGCNLTGPLPAAWAQGQLSELTYIDVHNNALVSCLLGSAAPLACSSMPAGMPNASTPCE